MKLIILDRDGVINHDSKEYIKSPDEWRPIKGSLEAIRMLTEHNYSVAVASNQSGIARGLYTHDGLETIHDKMHDMVADAGGRIEKIVYCPHHPDEGCCCRKPRPGMLHEIATHYNVSLQGVPFIGDRLTDVACAHAAGATPILIHSPMTSLTDEHFPEDVKTYVSLKEVVLDMINQ
jgi:D-glycero-D-manno-heptose 1,7-bisphosphate phosphatase